MGNADVRLGVGKVVADSIAEGVIEGKEWAVVVAGSGGCVGYGLACSVACS